MNTCHPESTQAKTELIVGFSGPYCITVPLAECETLETISPALRFIRHADVIGAVCATIHGRAAFDGDDWDAQTRVNIASFSIPMGRDKENGATASVVPVEAGYAIHWKARFNGRLHEETHGCYPTISEAFADHIGVVWEEKSVFMVEFINSTTRSTWNV